jgi:Family of unknown function (DUF6262)
MRPDNTTGMITAARRRHELTRAKAVHALRELDRTGAPITFDAVARTAGISRSWLYSETDLRAEIQRLRQTTRRAPHPPIPTTQRASDASLLARLQAATNRNRALTEENQRLRRQLAQALGEQRMTASGQKPMTNGETRHPGSITIRPH